MRVLRGRIRYHFGIFARYTKYVLIDNCWPSDKTYLLLYSSSIPQRRRTLNISVDWDNQHQSILFLAASVCIYGFVSARAMPAGGKLNRPPKTPPCVVSREKQANAKPYFTIVVLCAMCMAS